MRILFFKYHGTGNDFILIDNRRHVWRKSRRRIAALCARHTGIGADGLILLQKKKGYNFEMVYYNADGLESTLCGNGGRCAAHLAHRLGFGGKKQVFFAIDGPHEANMNGDQVYLKMPDVLRPEIYLKHCLMDTGSPHYLCFVDDVDTVNVMQQGAAIRNSNPFRKKGINVNFLQEESRAIRMRTYERGVEGETLSCGTGVAAAALYASLLGMPAARNGRCRVIAPGGTLSVKFTKNADDSFTNVWLEGPVVFVYEGILEM